MVFTALVDEISITGVTVNRGNCPPSLPLFFSDHDNHSPYFSHPDNRFPKALEDEANVINSWTRGACTDHLDPATRGMPLCPSPEELRQREARRKAFEDEVRRIHASVTLKFGEESAARFACGNVLEANVETDRGNIKFTWKAAP